jgi:vacuolar protein sorting-associated protein 45
MYNDFATLSEAFIKMLDKYKKNNHRELNADGDISIEALKDLVDNMPEMKHKSGIIGKHLSMLSQFKDQLQARDVWTTSEIEQDLACEDLDKDEGKSRIIDFVYPKDENDPETPPCRATGDDLLRLVMLWALKYEDRDDRDLLDMLQDKGVRNADDMLGSLIEYAGRESRDKSWNNLMAKAKKRDAIKRMATFWKDAPDVNIFLRHQPLIVGLLDKAFAGELDEADFPQQCGPDIDSPTEVIVFIVGGATYCEAAAVAKYNQEHPGKKVVLGGTCVHNSESFLQLVAQQPR